MNEIQKMSEEIDFSNLTYYFTSPNLAPIHCIGFRIPINIYKQIKKWQYINKETEEDQKKKIKSNLSEIASGNPKHREKYKSYAIKNARNLYNSRQKVIDLFNDYVEIKSEAMYKTKQRTGPKISAPKQMLQRLTIALAQVKAGNNSESLLNEIRQIVHSFYQSKEITKRVYNNVIKSIKI